MCWNETDRHGKFDALWSNKAISASLPRLLVIWDDHITHNALFMPYFLLFIDFICIIFSANFIIVDVTYC